MERILSCIKKGAENFKNNLSKNEIIRIISHYDCDGISAASILAKTFQRLDISFHVSFVKQLEKKVIDELKKEKNSMLFILDLSYDLEKLKEINSRIFILDHHEISGNFDKIPENIEIMNPFVYNKKEGEEISGAGLTYLFSRALDEKNKDLANLAIIGMIGDILDTNISKINNYILQDSDVTVKKGLRIFSYCRPIRKALEFSNIFIPGVTGSENGVLALLRESGIKADKKTRFIDLTDQELSTLVTTIVLRRLKKMESDEPNSSEESADSILGNVYLLKFFNRTEDAKELSTLINACGRLEKAEIALAFCLGSKKAKEEAETLYFNYKMNLISALKFVEENEDVKIENERFVLINCKNNISDRIVGTVTSILSSSFLYPEGKVIVGLAYRDDGKIKVSARISGRNKHLFNLKDLLYKACSTANIEGESGGHAKAAGCLIPVTSEGNFIDALNSIIK